MAREPLRGDDPSRVGRYRLTARLGSGGMGVVYLGVDPDIPGDPGDPGPGDSRQVAIKVLRPELADDPEFRARFGREVASLMRVRGDCTVRVIEADTRSSQPFMVTEYAAGPSLSEYIDTSGPLDAGLLHGLAAGLAEALTAIHAAGVVHRDLKPSNVILGPDGPRVIDFGIAQTLDATSVTKTGMMVGSAGFMAPEQVIGRPGQAADIFVRGVTVAYAATGQPPFGTGDTHAVSYRVMHSDPDISDVPQPLRPLVAAARRRPASPGIYGHPDRRRPARLVPSGAPEPGVSFTALTAGPGGFTAAVQFTPAGGAPEAAVWTSANGAGWARAAVSGLTEGGGHDLSALALSGSAVTGIDSVQTQAGRQFVLRRLPAG